MQPCGNVRGPWRKVQVFGGREGRESVAAVMCLKTAKHSERNLLFSSCGHSGHLLHPGGLHLLPDPPTPPGMSHLTQCRPSAFSSGGNAPEVSGPSSSLSQIRRNNLVRTPRPPLSSPPPQQVTESRDSGSGWRGSGGSIIQIPHMSPPRYSGVFEIAGMPADRARSAAQLKAKLMLPASDRGVVELHLPRAATRNSERQHTKQKHGARCCVAAQLPIKMSAFPPTWLAPLRLIKITQDFFQGETQRNAEWNWQLYTSI